MLRCTFSAHVLTVQTGTVSDPTPDRFYSESAFWHALKKALNNGHTFRGEKLDLIKKLMWKDGHLVDDHEYYLRDRKGRYCIFDRDYNIRDLAKEFNRAMYVSLAIHDLV